MNEGEVLMQFRHRETIEKVSPALDGQYCICEAEERRVIYLGMYTQKLDCDSVVARRLVDLNTSHDQSPRSI